MVFFYLHSTVFINRLVPQGQQRFVILVDLKHIKLNNTNSLSCVIVRVSVDLKRTVGDSD